MLRLGRVVSNRPKGPGKPIYMKNTFLLFNQLNLLDFDFESIFF